MVFLFIPFLLNILKLKMQELSTARRDLGSKDSRISEIETECREINQKNKLLLSEINELNNKCRENIILIGKSEEEIINIVSENEKKVMSIEKVKKE